MTSDLTLSNSGKTVVGLVLRVFGPGGPMTHVLPEKGVVRIGRSRAADVCIEDPALSRLHAALHVEPGAGGASQLSVEDLGSSNGTLVHGRKLPPGRPQPIIPGETIDVGDSLLRVELSDDSQPVARWTEGDFVAVLEAPCARARDGGPRLSVFWVRVPPTSTSGKLTEVGRLLRSELAVVAETSEGEFGGYSTAQSEDHTQGIITRVIEKLATRGIDCHVGAASCPDEGCSPMELVQSALERARAEDDEPEGVVIRAPEMKELHRLIARVAKTDLSVLILGETGVGKEILARTVHDRSKRADRPFMALNCGAFTETLLESELFGYEKGAFTGAVKDKLGLLESAAGGTVFFDEVGELTAAFQVKLLRVIEERSIRRVGGLEARPIDVRFISATHVDLPRAAEAGAFRSDLFYRLNGITLNVPPLRARPSEIRFLARLFAGQAAAAMGFQVAPEITPSAEQWLEAHGWPGNIRELRNVIERAVALCGGAVITLEHLPHARAPVSLQPEPLPPGVVPRGRDVPPDLLRTQEIPLPAIGSKQPPARSSSALGLELKDLEKRRILEALEQCAGNQTRAAAALGMSRKTLLARLDAYGIPRPRKRG